MALTAKSDVSPQARRAARTALALAFLLLLGVSVRFVREVERHRRRNEHLAACAVLCAPTLDLDQDSAARLETLPGLGRERARRIVLYRELFGRLVQPIDLILVPGIGPALVGRLSPFVRTAPCPR